MITYYLLPMNGDILFEKNLAKILNKLFVDNLSKEDKITTSLQLMTMYAEDLKKWNQYLWVYEQTSFLPHDYFADDRSDESIDNKDDGDSRESFCKDYVSISRYGPDNSSIRVKDDSSINIDEGSALYNVYISNRFQSYTIDLEYLYEKWNEELRGDYNYGSHIAQRGTIFFLPYFADDLTLFYKLEQMNSIEDIISAFDSHNSRLFNSKKDDDALCIEKNAHQKNIECNLSTVLNAITAGIKANRAKMSESDGDRDNHKIDGKEDSALEHSNAGNPDIVYRCFIQNLSGKWMKFE